MSGQLLEDRTGIKARTPMPTHDVTSATKILDFTGATAETITYADGAAGTTQQIKLNYDGVMSSTKDRVGIKGDTSLVFSGGTVLTTEVPWRYKNVDTKSHGDNDTDRLTSMANGEFMVDHENGYILGKNAISTSSTTETVDYSVRSLATTTVAGGGGDASAANQVTEIGLLTTIDADTSTINTSTSSSSASLVDLLANNNDVILSGTGAIVSGGEIVDPTSLSSFPVGSRQVEIKDQSRRGVVTQGTQLDTTNDSVSTQPVEPSNINTTALATSLVVLAAAGTLYQFAGFNTGPSQVIQLHDAASLPADTAVPEVKFWVAADSAFSRTFPQGISLTVGIVLSNSSTLSTKTIGAADCEFDATYLAA